MWMGEHQGLQVAVKVLRVYSTSDFGKVINASYLCSTPDSPSELIENCRDFVGKL